MLLPHREKERIDKQLPIAEQWRTETADPKRAKLLKDNALDKCTKFKTLKAPLWGEPDFMPKQTRAPSCAATEMLSLIRE
jgi:hypothetical protein